MMRVALDRSERLRIDGVEYDVRLRTTDGYQLLNPRDGALLNLGDEEIVTRLFAGSLERLPPGHRDEDGADVAPTDFSSSSDGGGAAAAKHTRYVQGVIDELGAPPHDDASLTDVIAKVHAAHPGGDAPVLRTLRRWLAKQKPAGWDAAEPAKQLPNLGRTQGRRPSVIPAVVERIMQDVLDERVWTTVPDTVYGAYSMVKRRIDEENAVSPHLKLKLPSETTFWRRYDKRDAEHRARLQLGARAARRGFGNVGTPNTARWPNEIVEADHNYIACNLIDEDGIALGPAVITLGVDRYTSMATGYALSFEPPSYTSDMLFLRHAVRPKTYLQTAFEGRIQQDWPCAGLPGTLFVDNGPDLHSSSLKAACNSQGITAIWATPAEPWQKGQVERAFLSLDEMLAKRLPGAKLVGKKLPDDYDAEKAARVGLRELNELLHMLFADIFPALPWPYDQTKTRREIWNDGVKKHPLRLPRSIRDFEILTRATLPSSRKLRVTGVEVFGMFYKSAATKALRTEAKRDIDVDVYYDPTDLKDVWVTPVGEKAWALAHCTAGKYVQKRTLWQHRKILDHLDPENRRRANEDQLLDAYARLRTRVGQIVGKKHKRRHSKKAHTRLNNRAMTPDELAMPPETAFEAIFEAGEDAFDAEAETDSAVHENDAPDVGPTPAVDRTAALASQQAPPQKLAAGEASDAQQDSDDADLAAAMAAFAVRRG